MRAAIVEHHTVDGFAAVTVRNAGLELTMLPELGGKLSSIRDLGSGREWLWRNPALPYRRAAYGASYIREADTGGWDECFPTVAACRYPSEPWRGLELPDHGELWSQPWRLEVVSDARGGVELRTTAAGVGLPYRFERRVLVEPQRAVVRFEYRVSNTGDHAIDWIWSAHPLLALEPGMRLRLPPSARLRSYVTLPDQLGPTLDGTLWPPRFVAGERAWENGELPDASSGLAMKLWSEPLTQGWAELSAADAALRLSWDAAQVPQVGLWLNAGGWSGVGAQPYYNLGLEPCIGAQDRLDHAVERYELYAKLDGGAERNWWLELHMMNDE